jgi:hypothetical protein
MKSKRGTRAPLDVLAKFAEVAEHNLFTAMRLSGLVEGEWPIPSQNQGQTVGDSARCEHYRSLIDAHVMKESSAMHRLAIEIHSKNSNEERGGLTGISYEEALKEAAKGLNIKLGANSYGNFKSWRNRNKDIIKDILDDLSEGHAEVT